MFGKNNQKKEEIKRRKNLEKILEFSNNKLWKSFSKNKRNKIIDKYYNLIDSSNIDIRILLEESRQTRITFGTLALAMLFGVFSSALASIMLKYTPNNLWGDIGVVICFLVVFAMILKLVGDFTKDDFRNYKILDRLLKLVEGDEIIKNNSISKK